MDNFGSFENLDVGSVVLFRSAFAFFSQLRNLTEHYSL